MGEKRVKIRVFDKNRRTPYQRALIRRAARTALGGRSRKRGELCIIFVSDKEMRAINKSYLRHDYPTDVLSFPYPDTPAAPQEDAPFGDIYIALGVAKRQAQDLGHDALSEHIVLTVHGTLHLVGYDDRKPADKRRMFTHQEKLLRRLRPSLFNGKK